MLRESQHAMRSALAFGPDYCQPDLFAGRVDAIVRGLKAHANQISQARHFALVETYPRTRALIGAEAFHQLAEIYLLGGPELRLPLARIGLDFHKWMSGRARDLAAVEWAWLEAHGAADAPVFDFAAIAGLTAKRTAESVISRHPAATRVILSRPAEFEWDGSVMAATAILVTRPRFDVFVSGIDPSALLLLEQLDRPQLLGELLERDAAATTALVTAGALRAHVEITL